MENEAYNEAREKANAAFKAFAAVRDAYRAGGLDDETFLAAKAIYAQTQADFDVAFDAASKESN